MIFEKRRGCLPLASVHSEVYSRVPCVACLAQPLIVLVLPLFVLPLLTLRRAICSCRSIRRAARGRSVSTSVRLLSCKQLNVMLV